MIAASPEFLEHELQRMAAVRRYAVLDTPPDGAFDRITAMLARRMRVPIAIISIVDEDRIWFKSHHGLDVTEIPRDPGLCSSAILGGVPYVISDTRIDPRSLSNPMVAGSFGLRFYAAVPLKTSDGFNLGTLCVLDTSPREVEQAELADMEDLASVVMDQMELRLAARLSAAKAQLMAKEVDNRIMDSLQFISGLLAMQSRTASGEAAHYLESASNRVVTVARVHQHYSSDDGETTSALAYLQRLCEDLSAMLGVPVQVSGDPLRVARPSIQPLGLVVNELVTNAAKHGAGTVRVWFGLQDGMHTLTVADEGRGFPAGFDIAKSTGLGMRVAQTLARQLGGTFTVGRGEMGRGAHLKVAYRPTASRAEQ